MPPKMAQSGSTAAEAAPDVRKESSSTLQVPDPEYPSTSKFLIRGIPKSSSSSNCIPSSSTSSSSSSSTSSSPAETHLGPPPNSPTSSSSSSSSSSSPSSSSTSSSSSPSSSSSDNWICVSDDQDKVVLKRLPTGAHKKLHATGKNLVRRPQLRWVRKIMKDRNKQRRRKKAATNSEYPPPQ